MTQFFTFPDQILSSGGGSQGWDKGLLGDATSGGNGTAAESPEVMAIAMCDLLLDKAKLAQAPQT
jgi:hypothetical protein